MGFLSRASLRAGAAARAAEAARIKGVLAPLLGLAEADALSINEIACADPGCADLETVVLVMRAGEPTRAFRVRAAAAAVGEVELRQLAQDERQRRAAGA